MSTYQRGEIVRITLTASVVEEGQATRDGGCPFRQLLVYCGTGDSERMLSIDVDAPGLVIERVAPAEWPPQPGDVWKDRDGDAWFGVEVDDDDASDGSYVVLQPVKTSKRGGIFNADLSAINERHGPMRLVHREQSSEPDQLTAADLITRTDIELVTSPGWRGGEPVRVLSAHWAGEHYDEVAVRYQDVPCWENAVQVLVAADHPIALAGGDQ